MGAMARKPAGTKVRLQDPTTGKIVWVDRAAIHSTTDEPAEVEPPAPAQDGSSPNASAPIHASPSVPSSAPTIAPPVAPSIAPPMTAADPMEEDLDEPDDVAEFLGEARPRRSRMVPSHAPATSPAPASSRRASGDDVADFWAGADPLVEDGELDS